MNSIQNAKNRKLMTLPDPEYHFKLRNLMKNTIFQQKTTLFITYHNTYHYLTTLQVQVFYIARNIHETLTYNNVGVTTPNFIFLVIIIEKNMRKSLKTHI